MEKLKDIIKNNHFETLSVLKALTGTHRSLGELKGISQSIPNQAILVNSLSLQEAEDSSAIENIVTTQDEIYKQSLQSKNNNIAAKEVENYKQSLHFLFKELQTDNLLTVNKIVKAQEIIKGNRAGIRQQQGTKLINEQTQQIVYTPPSPQKIKDLLKDLEVFINDYSIEKKLDPLIKMALIHHQFESIHPFYDGNGRIGRIINIIYLIQQNLLDTPILYFSRYINHNKNQYYKLLQTVRKNNEWEKWLLFMIVGIDKTAQSTLKLVNQIVSLQQKYKHRIRSQCPKIYSQELINNIFKHPYTKIAFLQKDLEVTRITATRYLEKLVTHKFLVKQKLKKENYYFNPDLIKILRKVDNLSND